MISRQPVGHPYKAAKDDEGEKWWIDDPNNSDCPEVGPFDTKQEANDQRIRLDRFYQRNWKEWVSA